MTIDQFVSNNNGKLIDVDKYYGAQCWDLAELYAQQVLGVPKEPWAITLGPNGNAYEAWTVFDKHMQANFTKIPAGQQRKGDINVYAAHPGDSAGHICIELGGGQVFEQNAPYGSACAIHSRNNSNLLGSLRGGSMAADSLTKEEIIVIYDLAFDVVDGQVNPDVIAAFTGKTLDEFITFLHQDPSWQKHMENINVPAAINKSSVLSYLQNNLK